MEQSHLGPDMVKLLHAFNVVTVHSQGLSSSSHYFLPGQLTIAVKSMSQSLCHPSPSDSLQQE